MITKSKLKAHIDQFPDELSIDELIDRLVFIDKLEKRIKKSESEDVISEKDVEQEVQEWFK
tara:strand:- start:4296 stop:4478 length:183 start_codon:yes stop_codon:yes gene_type:complete